MAMQSAYEHYFGIRYYDSRYPRPNRLTLERVISVSIPGSTLVDIGAGNGRYAIPLARYGYNIIAVERCDVAREQLMRAAKALKLSSRIICFKDLADVDDTLLSSSRLALFLFGVLAHMCFAERRANLWRLRETMCYPAEAFGSVPNKLRRFRSEQSYRPLSDEGSKASRFNYSRIFGGTINTFEYTAFSPAELSEEFSSYGWTCRSIRAESVFGESAVTRSTLLGRVDAVASRLVSPRFGYDILFHIRAADSSSRSGERGD